MTPPFPAPLIILSPPRSFSTVISTMLGEHPQMYGFPELHLFLGATVQEVISIKRNLEASLFGPHGALRAIAQIHDGIQTTATLIRAACWLRERNDWSTKKLLDYLFASVSPKVSIEKTPLTASKPEFMERAFGFYPDAFYLHITRHPVANRESLRAFHADIARFHGHEVRDAQIDEIMTWHFFHSNIVRFTSTLPTGQTLRLRGEDLLSEPDLYLPQVAEWMGLRTDASAIEAMKHPETSPYAFFAPAPAQMGNDPKFLRSPKLRSGTVRKPSLGQFFRDHADRQWIAGVANTETLRLAEEEAFKSGVADLATFLGYW